MTPDDRFTVDEAPIPVWLAHTPKIWEKRLARHALTGESLDREGVSLAEHVVGMSYRARLPHRSDSRHDEKLSILMETCKDPRSSASVWLRAILPVFHAKPPATEQIELLAAKLKEKLDQQTTDKGKLKWAMIAVRAGATLCEKQKFEPGQLDACVRLLATAWQAMPETMKYEGDDTLPIRYPSGFQKKPWEGFQTYVISIARNFDRNQPTPSELLPLQLWMAPEYDDLPLVDQETAKTNMGLVPSSMYGHNAFIKAIEAGVPWPEDPRVEWMANWFRGKNPYLSARLDPVIQSSSLARQTPHIEALRNRTRL